MYFKGGSAEESRGQPHQSYGSASYSRHDGTLFLIQEEIEFDFGEESMVPSYYPLMFEENKDSHKTTEYKPEGRTSFDDLKPIK